MNTDSKKGKEENNEHTRKEGSNQSKSVNIEMIVILDMFVLKMA